MTTLTITLRDDDQHFIETALKSGRYVSENEIVADALAALRAREERRQARTAELRAKIKVGIDQLDRGECAEWSAEDVMAEGRRLLAARKASA